jgi:hypothetical protein
VKTPHRILRPARRALGELIGLYWESGLGDEIPALSWFLLSSLVPLALGLTAVGRRLYLRWIAGQTPIELFLMLAGVLVTCYLAALGLLLGVGVTARVELGRPLGTADGVQAPAPELDGDDRAADEERRRGQP